MECLNVIDNKQNREGMVSQALTSRNEVMFGLKFDGYESISRVHTRRSWKVAEVAYMLYLGWVGARESGETE